MSASKVNRGRPKRKESSTNVLFDVLVPEEYDRIMIAGDIAEGRPVPAGDAAKMLWWAYVGPKLRDEYADKVKKTPEQVVQYLTDALDDPAHEDHDHYTRMAREVAVSVLEEEKLATVERQQFRAATRERILSGWERIGGSADKLERAMSAHRRRKRKMPG